MDRFDDQSGADTIFQVKHVLQPMEYRQIEQPMAKLQMALSFPRKFHLITNRSTKKCIQVLYLTVEQVVNRLANGQRSGIYANLDTIPKRELSKSFCGA